MKITDFRRRLAPLLVVVAAGAVFAAKHSEMPVPQVKLATPVPILPVRETQQPVKPVRAVLLETKPVLIETKATAAPFTLAASIENNIIEGQPVILSLTLHNSGKERLMIGGSAFEPSSFHFTVTNSAGQTVPQTADGERVLTPPMAVSANATVLIGPEQSIEYHFNLARLFDLSRTGVYQVSASRTVAPWAFNLPAPVAGQPATPKQADLILKPISFHMTEDAVSISGPASAPSPTHQTFLYMTGQEGNGVSRYRVGNDGDVSSAFPPANPDPVPPAKEGFHSITATPDGHFLYVSNGGDSTVSQFRIGDDGVLLPLSPPTVPAHPFPSYPSPLLMDPKGRFLYHLAGTLYTIGTDGRLTVTASVSNDPPPPNSSPQAPAHNYNVTASANGAIDSTGTFLYTSLGQTRGYRLAPDGGLAALPLPVGLASEENRANDMAFALAPSGKFAYVGESATLSNAYFDQIVTMRVAPDGTLSAVPGVTTPKAPPSQWPNQTRPDCLALSVDPSGRFLVVVNPQYLACYRIGADGSLTSLGAKQVGSDFTSVFFGSGGAVLYALNRDPAPLMAFRLDDRQGLVPAGVDLPSGLLSANFIAAVSAPTPLKWGSASGGFTISASLSGDVLPAAAPVVLTVAVKNVTSSPIFLGMSGAEMTSFHLSMSGPQRQSPGILRGVGEPAAASVPLLAAGHDLFDAPGKGGTELVIPPGQQRQYRFVLSRLADLTVAGNYTVQITRTLPGGAEVASPVVSFLLDGPYNGLTRRNFWQGVSVL